MSKPNTSGFLDGVSGDLEILWRKRDAALDYEKRNNITPRTSERFIEAQREVDKYFNPPEPKAKRKKPKKKTYAPEDGWAY